MLKNNRFGYSGGSRNFLGCRTLKSPAGEGVHCDFQQLVLPVHGCHTMVSFAFG
jgi:hypothetical protein